MIPAKNIRVARLADATAGDLFYSTDEASARILVGSAAGAKYAIFLEGEYAGRGFQIDAEQPRRGFIISGCRIELDHRSLVEVNAPALSLWLSSTGPTFIVRDNANGWLTKTFISFVETRPDQKIEAGSIAFPSWRLIIDAHNNGKPVVLYDAAEARALANADQDDANL